MALTSCGDPPAGTDLPGPEAAGGRILEAAEAIASSGPKCSLTVHDQTEYNVVAEAVGFAGSVVEMR